jgi:hypothetical protein
MNNSLGHLSLWALALVVSLASSGNPAQASLLLINFDLTDSSGGDAYDIGPGLFGNATSIWNKRSRVIVSNEDLALFDDTGATTSVTVTYTRNDSIAPGISGAYTKLGRSNVQTGPVTIKNLTPFSTYDLVIYSGWLGGPSWNVDSVTKSITSSLDWSSLNAGIQYVLFNTLADSGGQISFTPQPNPSGTYGVSGWSSFQLREATPASPATSAVPGPLPILGAAAAYRTVRKLRRFSSALQHD